MEFLLPWCCRMFRIFLSSNYCLEPYRRQYWDCLSKLGRKRDFRKYGLCMFHSNLPFRYYRNKFRLFLQHKENCLSQRKYKSSCANRLLFRL